MLYNCLYYLEENEMTNRERIIAAIKHEKTDFTPYSFDFTHQEYEKLAKYLDDKDFEQKIGYHMSGVGYDGWPREISYGSGYFKDDFGVVWNRNCADKDIGVIEGFVINEPTMKDYKFPDFDEKEYRIKLEHLLATQKDNFKYAAIGFSMFERAWSLRGMENVLMDMIDEPEFLHELLDGIAYYNLKIINIALEYDIDAFMFGDDWGQQKGLIMGPGFWREFIKPRMARMYARVKSEGKYIIQHSCGDLRDILPGLDFGLDCLPHGIERS